MAVVSQLRVPTWPSCSARVQSVPTPGTHPPVSSLNLPNLFGQLIFSARHCPPSKNLFYQKVIIKYVFFFHRYHLTCPSKLNNRPKTMSPQSLVLSTTRATQNNSPLDPLSHLCPISPIRFACIFSFFYLFCRWNRTCTSGASEWNWRLQQLAQLTHVPSQQVPCPRLRMFHLAISYAFWLRYH